MLIPDDEAMKVLKENSMPPRAEILFRHFMFFGPLPEALLRHVDDEKWIRMFRSASELAEIGATDDPDLRFERWSVENVPRFTPEAKDMVSKMIRLDPAGRAGIKEILEHQWW